MDILGNLQFSQETMDAVEGLLAMGPLTPTPATTPTVCPWAPTNINYGTRLEIEESEDEEAETQAMHLHYVKEMAHDLDTPWQPKAKKSWLDMTQDDLDKHYACHPIKMADGSTFKEMMRRSGAFGEIERPIARKPECMDLGPEHGQCAYTVDVDEDGVEHITIL